MATTQTFVPQDAAFERRVRDSFIRQSVMATLGATLERVGPGEVDIALPYRADLGQQHGFLHAGILATILDSACGYAAFTLMPEDHAVLSVEFKVTLLAPASGDRLFDAVLRKPFTPDLLLETMAGCLAGRMESQ